MKSCILFLFAIGCLLQITFAQNYSVRKESNRSEIRKWKHSIVSGSGFSRYSSVLMFPKGKISLNLWKQEILSAVNDSSELLRRAIALIIGNKRLYKNESMPALLSLLHDSSEYVAMDAIFSLASYGTASIKSLFTIIENGGFPYCTNLDEPPSFNVSNINSSPYKSRSNFLDGHIWPTKDLTERIAMFCSATKFYSRDAMRALFCLRQIGDSVLNYLPNIALENYYLVYLLEGINISSENINLYYKEFKRLIPIYNMEGSDYELYENLFYKKLRRQYSLDSCISIVKHLDSSLLKNAAIYQSLQKNELTSDIRSEIRTDLDSISLKKVELSKFENMDSLIKETPTWKILLELNKISIQKKQFTQTRRLFRQIINGEYSEVHYRALIPFVMMIISNIGDSAVSLHDDLLQFIGKISDSNIRYLTIKALLDIHKSSNGSYVYLQSAFFRQSFENIASVSNIMKEGRLLSWNSRGYQISLESNKILSHNIYLDTNFEYINQNVSSNRLCDISLQEIIRRFANDRDCRVREYVSFIIGKYDSLNSFIKNILVTYLQDNDYYVRLNACRSLIHFQYELSKRELAFTHLMILEDYLADVLQSDQDRIIDNAKIGSLDFPKGAFVGLKLPPFPDPPMRPSISGSILPKATLSDTMKLNSVFDYLMTDLRHNGYQDLKVFAFRDGIGVMTHLERIKKDGTIDTRSRWTLETLTAHTLSDYWNLLFYADEGAYQAIAFLASNADQFDQYSKSNLFDFKEYCTLFNDGGDYIPDSMKNISFHKKNIKMLVYYWKKDSYGRIVNEENPSNPIFSQCFNSLGLKSFKIR